MMNPRTIDKYEWDSENNTIFFFAECGEKKGKGRSSFFS